MELSNSREDNIGGNDSHLFDDYEGTSLISADGEQGKFYSEQDEKKEKVAPFPKSVFFIVGNEFCERFSYYGLKTVLALYLARQLMLTEDEATSVYHGWAALCYFTPLIGAAIADAWLGRYKTILYISLIYAFGNIVLSLAATTPIMPSLQSKSGLSALGLILIAFGTGGIKPCVAAFGGDQFKLPEQEKLIAKFFSFFYFSINAGSLVSTLLTPVLREDVQCFGDDCYTLAFGVPALLMLFAIVLFLVGSSRYKIVAPEGNILGKVTSCIYYAVRAKCLTKTEADHWLDLAEDRYGTALVQDVKALVRVLLLYLPLPIFWALFDQQGSRWTFEATKMNGFVGSFRIKPDQMQVLNPLFILLLIPAFNAWVYPTCTHFNILTKPLQRIFIGGILASLAFVVSGVIQMKIEDKPVPNIPVGNAIFVFLNPTPCDIELRSPLLLDSLILHPHQKITTDAILPMQDSPMNLTLKFLSDKAECSGTLQTEFEDTVQLSASNVNVFVPNDNGGQLNFIHFTSDSDAETRIDKAAVRLLDSTGTLRMSLHAILVGKHQKQSFSSTFFQRDISVSDRHLLEPGSYNVILPSAFDNSSKTVGSVSLEKNSDYIIYLDWSSNLKPNQIHLETFIIDGSTVHILWLLPQYILISIAEIMFSITGLEFSFTQAPDSMKSVVQAAWLMTVAVGNIFVMIAVTAKFVNKQSLEFFIFALLMFLDMLVFRWLATRYEYQKMKDEAKASIRMLSEQRSRSESESTM